jgi:hypothetical protein
VKNLVFDASFCGLLSVALQAYAAPSRAQSYVIDPRPTWTVQGTAPDGVPVFGRVAGATRLGDGAIVVADGSANALRFFDALGRVTRTVGRRGEGPGEFRQLGWVRQCAHDSLFAFDIFPRRISVFSASGRFVRQFLAPGVPDRVACSRHGKLAILGGGRGAQPPEGVTLWRRKGPLSIADTRGILTRELGDVLASEIARAPNGGWLPRLGGPRANIAVARDRVVVCPTDSDAVAVYSLTGVRRRSIPLRVPPRAPSRRDLERLADAEVALAPPGELRDTVRQRLLRLPAPARLPVCSNVLTDPDENVWVVLSVFGDSVTTLRVFGRDDRVLGDVSIPAALEIHEIGSDYLLASGETPEGEPWVRMYRVRRSPAR